MPLDALQLWVALPESRRHGRPTFEQHAELPVIDLGGGASATVVVGELDGVSSPAEMFTPIVGAELRLPAGARVTLPLRPDWEYALVGIDGDPTVRTEPPLVVAPQNLLYLGIHRDRVEIETQDAATLFLLGGEPFEDDIVMWWNFVARSHEEVVAAREAWEAGAERFGHVVGHADERVPAPPLPHVRLTQRRRRV